MRIGREIHMANVTRCDVFLVPTNHVKLYEQEPPALLVNGSIQIGGQILEPSKHWVLSSTDLESARLGILSFLEGNDVTGSTLLMAHREICDHVSHPATGNKWSKSHGDFDKEVSTYRIYRCE